MQCPRCQHENRSGAKFCEECAFPLARTCSNCGSQLPATAKFCPECAHPVAEPAPGDRFASPASYTPKHLAEKILTSKSALEGERKQVTVLFVDVSGFTSLSERLDAEEVHQLMSRAFDLMLAEVHRYEGTVNQFLGDGIMALFGAPIAHEDHARRAVHAALGIDRVLHDYTAVGDTTNVAARLQQVGEPGKVTISESTHRLARGYFDMRPLGAFHLKGKAEPVAAWEVVAAHETRTRLEVEADRGLTPFVGRERELGQLLEAFERARSGQGQVTIVVGEAGIGKSRLLHELRRRVGGEADWREGHCLSFGRAMAFHPLVDLVRRQFAVDDTDGDAAIATKIGQGLQDIGADVASCAPYLRSLLSVDPGDVDVKAMSPAQRRGETFEALRRMLVRAAERRPQVLVIEDLHWIDGASEEFLAMLVDTVPALRALLVFTYRPGYSHSFSERSYVTRVVPAALSTEDSARMVAAVLATAAVPEELHRLITGKAEGNPFYLEELVKSLEEGGALRRDGSRYELTRAVGEITIPGTIQDVIAARIDRLAEAPKRTLQLAAVIGREFTRRLVDRLAEVRERTEGFLRELTALELILERHLYPELAYMFKHALTQDVAYASLLVQRRRELHGLVGLAIEELYADRLPEHYEMLAHHFSRAEDWERALAYLLKAAEKATQAFGFRQALELYGNALDAIRRLGDRVPVATLTAIHRARADLFFGVGDFSQSREAAEELLALSRRIEDRPLEAGALVQLATASQWLEDFPSSLQQAQEAIEIAEAVGARGVLAGAEYVRSYVQAVSGKLEMAEPGFTRAIEIAREQGDRSQEALALHMLGSQRAWQGQYRESLELSRAGTRLGRDGRLVVPLLRNLWTEGLALTDTGHYDDALAALVEGLALAEKVDDQAYISRLLNTIGWLRIECGDLNRGIELSEASYEVTAKSSRAGHGTGAERRAFIRNNEGEAMMARGELAAAAEALEETHHIVRHPPPSRWMTWRYTSQCYAGLAQLALLRGDPERARRLADQSLEVAVPTRSRKFESWAWRIKGESATLRRAWGVAEDAVGRALSIAEAIGQPRHAWLGHLALGRLDAARGRRDDARRRYRAAWDIMDGLRARTQEATLRAGLEASPLVREVGDLARPEQ